VRLSSPDYTATAVLLSRALLLAVLFLPASGPAAEWKPDKPVEMVVPTSPGGGQDSMARTTHAIVQSKKMIEVPVTVVNKPGGGQAIGYSYINQKEGNAHYIAFSTVNLLTNQIIGTHPLTYTDVTPIAMLAHEYLLFAVRADSQIKNAKSLLDSLKRDPAANSIGFAPSLGGSAHISVALVARAAGVDARKMRMVIFKSGGEAATALLGGHVDVGVVGIPVVMPHVRAGNLRVIAVPAPKRLIGELSQVPTWRDSGVNAVFANWRGVIGPRGLTRDQIDYWERVFKQVAATDEWKRYLQNNELEDGFTDANGAGEFLRTEYEALRTTLTELGLVKK